MSPERARVFLVEDDTRFQRLTKDTPEEAGHKVVITATTFEEAREKVKKIREAGVNIALVDANLSKGDISGLDGQEIAQALRDEDPDIIIVAFSGLPQDYGEIWIDKNDLGQLVGIGETVIRL